MTIGNAEATGEATPTAPAVTETATPEAPTTEPVAPVEAPEVPAAPEAPAAAQAPDLYEGVSPEARERIEAEVKKVREEAAANRVGAQPFKQAFSRADEAVRDEFLSIAASADEQFLPELVGFLKDLSDPASARARLQQMLEQLDPEPGQEPVGGEGEGGDYDPVSMLLEPERFQEGVASVVQRELERARTEEAAKAVEAERIGAVHEKLKDLGHAPGSATALSVMHYALQNNLDLDAAHQALVDEQEAQRERRVAALSEEPTTNPTPPGGTPPGTGREINSLEDGFAAMKERLTR